MGLFPPATLAAVCVAFSAPFLTAQEAGQPPVQVPLHRPVARLEPHLALRHLQQGHRMWRAARTDRALDELVPERRPGGAGRYLAVVLCPPGMRRPPAEFLNQDPRNLLLLSRPGPVLGLEETALIEALERDHGVCLCVVLVARSGPPTTPGEGTAARVVRRHRLRAELEAARKELTVAQAHGHLQEAALYNGSPALRRAWQRRRFAVAVGIVDPRSGAVEWHAPWGDGWPIARPAPR